MRIPFYQVNAFLYAEEQLYKPPAEYKPEITFENYVKAQVHCCMYLTRYKDRSIRDYVDTLKLLKGEDNAKNRKAFKKVLNYYYKDLSNMLKRLKKRFDKINYNEILEEVKLGVYDNLQETIG